MAASGRIKCVALVKPIITNITCY